MNFKNSIIILSLLSFMSCKSQDLSVMTYNIRLDVASDAENAWPNRRQMLSDQVLFMAPDVLGVQEAKPNQILDLSASLKGYEYFGLGRDGGKEGEHSAIYYKSERFEVREEGTFWLSETPSEVSKGWDAAYPRICTYGLFTDLRSNIKFWIFNTHLDHVGEQARLKGIKLILDKISKLNVKNYPVVLMGDFNVEPNSQLIQKLTESMNDSRSLAEIRFGSEGTFNGFRIDEPISRRIDYIMLSKSSNVKVSKYGVLSSLIDQRFPSDHFPVFVQLQFE